MDQRIKVFGFGGSLRQGSITKIILNTAKEVAPDNMEVEIFEDLQQIPLFNQDLEESPPEVVKRFKAKIRAADAILISTPEYNYSIPGFLKNAIDWASRPHGDNSFNDKPVAIMSGGSRLGGARAQYALRQTFVYLNMHPVNAPEVMVPMMQEKIQNGKITDVHTREKIGELLTALAAWTLKISSK